MPGYVLMHADVTGPGGYEEFKSLAAAAIADHGGRYLVRGRRCSRLRASGGRGSSWLSFQPMLPPWL
jgi:uncharacterized protein (DUF1330 family)